MSGYYPAELTDWSPNAPWNDPGDPPEKDFVVTVLQDGMNQMILQTLIGLRNMMKMVIILQFNLSNFLRNIFRRTWRNGKKKTRKTLISGQLLR